MVHMPLVCHTSDVAIRIAALQGHKREGTFSAKSKTLKKYLDFLTDNNIERRKYFKIF